MYTTTYLRTSYGVEVMGMHRLDDALLLIAAIVLLMAALFLPIAFALADEEQTLLDAYEQGDLIRLHVVANSDSNEDQQIKLDVRDAIIAAFGEQLINVQSADEAYQMLAENRAMFEAIAMEHAQGQAVRAEVGRMQLPAKQYGSVTLPEGEYKALRITLGNGEGSNWWCVLFPQLCLALSENGEPEAKLYWDSERIFRQWLAFAN